MKTEANNGGESKMATRSIDTIRVLKFLISCDSKVQCRDIYIATEINKRKIQLILKDLISENIVNRDNGNPCGYAVNKIKIGE